METKYFSSICWGLGLPKIYLKFANFDSKSINSSFQFIELSKFEYLNSFSSFIFINNSTHCFWFSVHTNTTSPLNLPMTTTNLRNGISRTVLLMLASQRIESVVGNWLWNTDAAQNKSSFDSEVPTKRGATPSAIEWMILAWVRTKRQMLNTFSVPLHVFNLKSKKNRKKRRKKNACSMRYNRRFNHYSDLKFSFSKMNYNILASLRFCLVFG